MRPTGMTRLSHRKGPISSAASHAGGLVTMSTATTRPMMLRKEKTTLDGDFFQLPVRKGRAVPTRMRARSGKGKTGARTVRIGAAQVENNMRQICAHRRNNVIERDRRSPADGDRSEEHEDADGAEYEESPGLRRLPHLWLTAGIHDSPSNRPGMCILTIALTPRCSS